jgi:hypothetical protein
LNALSIIKARFIKYVDGSGPDSPLIRNLDGIGRFEVAVIDGPSNYDPAVLVRI